MTEFEARTDELVARTKVRASRSRRQPAHNNSGRGEPRAEVLAKSLMLAGEARSREGWNMPEDNERLYFIDAFL